MKTTIRLSMRLSLIFILAITSFNIVYSQNILGSWNLTLSSQNESVLVDTDFQRTYLIERSVSSPIANSYKVLIKVDDVVLTDGNNKPVILEVGSSMVVRGQKIIIIREPNQYSGNHIIIGTFQLIGEVDDLFVDNIDFSIRRNDDNSNLLIKLENPRRVRIAVNPVHPVSVKPYLNIYVDGELYKNEGNSFKLQEGSTIELFGKEISINYPTSAPSLPNGTSTLKGKFSVFNN